MAHHLTDAQIKAQRLQHEKLMRSLYSDGTSVKNYVKYLDKFQKRVK